MWAWAPLTLTSGLESGGRWPPRGGSSAQPHITIETRDRSGKGAHHPSRLVPPPAVLDPVDVAVRLLLEVAPRLRSRCAHKEHRLQSCKAAHHRPDFHYPPRPNRTARPNPTLPRCEAGRYPQQPGQERPPYTLRCARTCKTPLLLGLGEPAVPLHSPGRGRQRAQANLCLHHAVDPRRSNLFVAFDLRSQIVPGLGRGGVDIDREDRAARGQQRKRGGQRSRQRRGQPRERHARAATAGAMQRTNRRMFRLQSLLSVCCSPSSAPARRASHGWRGGEAGHPASAAPTVDTWPQARGV